jgi:hypothetical protein
MPDNKCGKPARPFELWNIEITKRFTGKKGKTNTLLLCSDSIRHRL